MPGEAANRILRLVGENLDAKALLDIFLVAIAVYYLLLLIRGTRAFQLLKGLAILGLLILLANGLQLRTLSTILGQMLVPGVIAVIVIFSPELRLALEQMGRGRLIPSLPTMEKEEISRVVNEVVSAAAVLSRERVGALIAIESHVGLNDIIATGREVGGAVTSEILRTIFYPGTPLHDLAVVIRGNRLMAAGCLLPLSERDDKSFSLGTRHRAALGLSETSDALIVVVSEETGTISLAHEGRLFSNLSADALKARLLNVLSPAASKVTAAGGALPVPALKTLWRRLPLAHSEKESANNKEVTTSSEKENPTPVGGETAPIHVSAESAMIEDATLQTEGTDAPSKR
jgi:diadenylate cyclase